MQSPSLRLAPGFLVNKKNIPFHCRTLLGAHFEVRSRPRLGLSAPHFGQRRKAKKKKEAN